MLKRKDYFGRCVLRKAGILGLSTVLLAGMAVFPSQAAVDTDVKLMLDESAEAFDITMPTEMLLKVNGEGDVALASDFSIQNNSVYPVHVKGAELIPENFNFYESQDLLAAAETKDNMFFRVKPDGSALSGALNFGEAYSAPRSGSDYTSFASGNNYDTWCIESGGSLNIVDSGDGKASGLRNMSRAKTIGKMTWTIEAADAIDTSALEGKVLSVLYYAGDDGTFAGGVPSMQVNWVFGSAGAPCISLDSNVVEGAEKEGYRMEGFTSEPGGTEKLRFYDNGSPIIETQADIDFWAAGGYPVVYVRWLEE